MKDLRDITLLGIMTAIILVMMAIPGIGFIPIGPINATIVHIPVIIFAIVKGPRLGAILGGIFGIASFLNAILRPNLTSFIFMNPLVSIFPRILIGLIVGYISKYFILSKNYSKRNIIIASGLGSLINTIGVLSLIYLIYAKSYMEAIGKSGQSALTFLLGIASTSGIIEMIVCMIISTPIAYALLKLEKKRM